MGPAASGQTFGARGVQVQRHCWSSHFLGPSVLPFSWPCLSPARWQALLLEGHPAVPPLRARPRT